MWIKKLKELKAKSGKTSTEIANETGIPKSTVDKIFAEVTKEPPLSSIYKIVHCFGFTLDDLTNDATVYSPEDKELLYRYHSLDVHGKKIVDMILDVEYNRCQTSQEQEPEQDNIINLPYYYGGVSAGFGNPTVDEYKVLRQVPRTALTEKADFIVQVNGDSMFPTYSDGDLLLIKSQQSVEIGEVGIFVVNGSEMYVKRYDGKKLVPDNKKYPDIPISEDTVCQGKVIGKL